METYNRACQAASADVTQAFSTSFGLAIRLMPAVMRPDIYNIYGLVRVADEIVDTYRGKDARGLLDDLELETYAALDRKYSANVLVHAFMLTAGRYGIGRELIEPFFASMRADLTPQKYTRKKYKEYIYGSAEVVGLMCVRVFCKGDDARYAELLPGARALGSAFQKVNFLRDIAADTGDLHRAYFPGVDLSTMTEADKQAIVADIKKDFVTARAGVVALPSTARPAVMVAYKYYRALLRKIEKAPVATLRTTRIRLPNAQKIVILAAYGTRERLRGRT